jgi:hypothetical protein
VLSEVLDRLERLEARVGEHDRTVRTTYSAIEYALKAKGVAMPGLEDTQPLPVLLGDFRSRRASAG